MSKKPVSNNDDSANSGNGGEGDSFANKESWESFNSGIIGKTDHFDLFISYKRDNGGGHGQKLAEELYEKLIADGYMVLLDNLEIGCSTNFEKRIEETIVHSKKFVCILGPSWVNSPNCRYEFQKAVELEKRIIPVNYQDFRTLLKGIKKEELITQHELNRIDKPQEVDFQTKAKFAKSYLALKSILDLKDKITEWYARISLNLRIKNLAGILPILDDFYINAKVSNLLNKKYYYPAYVNNEWAD